MKPTRLTTAIVLALSLTSAANARTSISNASKLPSGYLITSGSQITDLSGHKVRLACVGYFQMTSGIVKDVADMAQGNRVS